VIFLHPAARRAAIYSGWRFIFPFPEAGRTQPRQRRGKFKEGQSVLAAIFKKG
jgi:hypothetical protein